MLNLDDERWSEVDGGYRMPIDVRPLLLRLSTGRDIATVWSELWDELHHQGDVGLASYAAVPHLVRIYCAQGKIDWNTYSIVAVIEIARTEGNNPELPDWLKIGYFEALNELAKLGAIEILRSDDEEVVRSILSILAIAKGLRTYGRLLAYYSEAEIADMEMEGRLG